MKHHSLYYRLSLIWFVALVASCVFLAFGQF